MIKIKKLIHLQKIDLTDKKQGFQILLVGVVLALILGGIAINLSWTANWLYWVLAIGVIVGILNIFHEEGILFLVSGLTITFMLTVLVNLPLLALWATTLFKAVIYLLAPATVVVGLKVLYALAVK